MPEDKEIIAKFEQAMLRFEDQRKKGLEEKWRQADQMSQNESVGHYYDSQSQTIVGAVHDAIRTVASRMNEILWGSKESFSFRRMKSNLEGLYRCIKALIYFQFERINPYRKDFYSVLSKLTRAFCTYGKCIVKVTWQINEGKKKRRVWRPVIKRNEAGVVTSLKYEMKTEVFNTTLFDGPVIENIDIFRLYFDAEISELEAQPILIEKQFFQWEDLVLLRDQGVYTGLTEEHKIWAIGSKRLREAEEKQEIQRNRGVSSDIKGPVGAYEVWQCYSREDIDGDGYAEKAVCSILVSGTNEKAIIQPQSDIPYDYAVKSWPYLDSDFEEDIYSAYGQGIPGLCKESYINLQDNRRKTIDAGTMHLNNMWLWDRNAGVPPKYLVSQKNKVIGVDTWPGIQPLRPEAKMVTVGLQMEKLLQDEIMRTSMATASLQGLPSRYGTTAFETSQLLTQSNVTVVDVIKRFEKEIIEPTLEMVYALDRQFMTKEQVIQITGKDGFAYPVIIYPWQFKDVDFIALGSTHMENKLVLTNQLMRAIEMAVKIPQASEIIKIKNCIRKWFELWEIPNVEDYVMGDESIQVSPLDENIMLLQGQDIEVNSNDEDMIHTSCHLPILNATNDRQSAEIVVKHIQAHFKQAEKKKQQAQVMQQLMMEQQMASGGGKQGLPRTGPSPQQTPSTQLGMNKQISEVGAPDMGRGVTP